MLKPNLSKRYKVLAALVLVTLILVGILSVVKFRRGSTIDSYDECIAEGGVLLETHPQQCKTKQGKTFTAPFADEVTDNGEEIIFSNIKSGENTATPFTDQKLAVQNKAEWDDLWPRIDNQSLKPEIDFTKEMVIGLFMGEQPSGGYSVEATKATESDKIVVYVQVKSPGLGCTTTQNITSPYSLIKIAKSDKTIQFKVEQKIVNCYG